jgi:Zn-dependent protease
MGRVYRGLFSPCPGEVRDALLALVALTAVFFLVFRAIPANPALKLAGAFLAVITGFLGHELMHREVARRLGYIACFKAWIWGLLLALVTAALGFTIAAPGATMIGPKVMGFARRDEELRIALAGPATNIFFALFFLALTRASLAYGNGTLYLVSILAFSANAILGFFNLLPIAFPGILLDGYRIFASSKPVWLFTFLVALALFIVSIFPSIAL